jgi:hypothetical protein
MRKKSWLERWITGAAQETSPETEVTLYGKDVTTIASTSANAVIREFTSEFAREMKEKADKLDKVTKSSD